MYTKKKSFNLSSICKQEPIFFIILLLVSKNIFLIKVETITYSSFTKGKPTKLMYNYA